MKNDINWLIEIQSSLIRVLKEFGPVGLITYVGGLTILTSFFFTNDSNKQFLYAVTGIILILLSVMILYLHIRQESLREKSLIEMVTSTANNLAERLNENVPKEQAVSITQTIWQTQKDLINRIIKGDGNRT